MRTTWLLMVCALFFGASLAQGAEYFIYRDSAGTIVLSNIRPTAEAEVLERYDLQEVSEEALRAAREREHSFWLGLQDEELARSNRELAESNHRLAEAITTNAALRETAPGVLVQVASSHGSRFQRPHTDPRQTRAHSQTGFRHTKIR
ncbi:MAG TPA: hypothetical protein VF089_16270 [Candidatus Binatia bacterium]